MCTGRWLRAPDIMHQTHKQRRLAVDEHIVHPAVPEPYLLIRPHRPWSWVQGEALATELLRKWFTSGWNNRELPVMGSGGGDESCRKW